MAKIAHLKLTCPQCVKYTSIYVEEGGSSAKVKCEHCKKVFELGAGRMYEQVAYVPSIPKWEVISKVEAKSTHTVAIQCKKCGETYNETDAAIQDNIGGKDFGLLDPSNPAVRKILGLTSLLKCGNCSAIACSNCALESDSIIKMRCPFCKTDYTIYSFIKPTAENISGEDAKAKDKPKTKKSFFNWFLKIFKQ